MIKKRKRTTSKWIGDILIAVSLAFLLAIYLPIIWIYLFPKHIQPVYQLKGFTITIPKINAQANIIEQVNPWNQQTYDAALEKGVAQAEHSAYPSEQGTIYLFAHSSTWPISYTNVPFLRLGELNANDPIYITWKGNVYIYKVRSKKEIWPNEISYLQNLKPTELILQTCTPIGTSFKRLLVFAKLDEKLLINDQ